MKNLWMNVAIVLMLSGVANTSHASLMQYIYSDDGDDLLGQIIFPTATGVLNDCNLGSGIYCPGFSFDFTTPDQSAVTFTEEVVLSVSWEIDDNWVLTDLYLSAWDPGSNDNCTPIGGAGCVLEMRADGGAAGYGILIYNYEYLALGDLSIVPGHSSGVPTPATIPLLGIALAAVGFSRKRKLRG